MNIIKEKFVAKKNELIEGISDLDLLDFNLINLVISKIDSINDEDLKAYTFKKKEIAEFLKLGKNYNKLDTLLKTIPYKKIIVNTEKNEYMTCYWFHATVRESEIEFRIDPKLKPYLIKLSKDFTQYELTLTRKFRSKYSFKFYEWFLMHYNKNKRYKKIVQLSLEINMIKSNLFLSTSYANNFHLLNKRVLEPSLTDINLYTNLSTKFIPVKTGKKVTSLDFFITSKNLKIKDDNKSLKNEETTDEFFNKIWSLYPMKKNVADISYSDIEKLKLYGYDIIKTCIHRYIKFVEEKRKEGFNQSYQHGNTFFTKGYIDYLDKNYIPYLRNIQNRSNYNKPIQSTNFDQRIYDDDFFESLYDNLK